MGERLGSREAAGYVMRETGIGRGRRIAIRLTEDGEQALARAIPIVDRSERETISGLSAAEVIRSPADWWWYRATPA